MNEIKDIEKVLRKAPQTKVPRGLLERLEADIVLARAEPNEPVRPDASWLFRRWIPALSFGLLFVTAVVALAVQTSQLLDLRRANARLQASSANLEQLQLQNAELQQSQAKAQELERSQKERDELLNLRVEVARLRTLAKELPALRSENQRLHAERALALAATLKSNQPRIAFSETNVDFGEVAATETLKHEFVVINTGNALLEILSVMPGCGCTTAGEWDRQIEPGKTGKIPIALNPASFSGPLSKSITVTCNDPDQGIHKLQIRATVWRPLDVQPRQVYFLQVEDERTNETKVVRIINNAEDLVALEAPHSDNPAFQAELKMIRPGKEFELHVAYSASVSNAARQANISLQTSAASLPMLNVTASVISQAALVTVPPPVKVPAGPFDTDYRLPVMIRNNSAQPVKLFEPSVNVESVTAQLEDVEMGKSFKINLTFPANFQADPRQKIELAVRTTHPKYPVFRVPILQAASQPAAPTTQQ